jgi:hypothetical protein
MSTDDASRPPTRPFHAPKDAARAIETPFVGFRAETVSSHAAPLHVEPRRPPLPSEVSDPIHVARAELDRAGLPHSSFTPEALALVVRSSEGILRRVRNLCLGALIEAVRDRVKTVDLKQVNRVLIQPHWREQREQAS